MPPTISQPNDRLAQLSAAGVAVWLDDISRDRLVTGNLAELIRTRHVVGVTSNPTIFEHALSKGSAYNDQIRDLALRQRLGRRGVARDYHVRHPLGLRCAAARLRRERGRGRPGVARGRSEDRQGSARADRRRGASPLVDGGQAQPVHQDPRDPEGLPAITQCLAEGISVNVTLIFSLTRYGGGHRRVLRGPGEGGGGRARTGRDHLGCLVLRQPGGHARWTAGSTRSARRRRHNFVARRRSPTHGSPTSFTRSGSVRPGWDALRAAGAHPQRPLWASTSTKDPAYDDTRYVVDLVAPGRGQHDARVDHRGRRRPRGAARRHDSRHATTRHARSSPTSKALGIGYDDVTAVLETEGVEKFSVSWTELLDTIEKETARVRGSSQGQASGR